VTEIQLKILLVNLKKRIHHTLVLTLEIFYTRNKYNGVFALFFFLN